MTTEKSQLVGCLLALLVGPLGLFYSRWQAAVCMILFLIILSLGSLGIGAPIYAVVWIVSILASFAAIAEINGIAQRQKELLATAPIGQEEQATRRIEEEEREKKRNEHAAFAITVVLGLAIIALELATDA